MPKPIHLLLCLTALCAVAAAQEPNAETLVNRALAARGGADKIAAIRSMRMKATLSGAPLLVIAKRPSLFRVEIGTPNGLIVQAFDGTDGWLDVKGKDAPGPSKLSGAQLAGLRDQAANAIGGPLVDAVQRDNHIELEGREQQEGRNCYKLKIVLPGGRVIHEFLDPETYLAIHERLETSGDTTAVIEETIGDYQRFGGFLFPCSFVSGSAGATEKQTLLIQQVEINPELDAALFTMRPPVSRSDSESKVPTFTVDRSVNPCDDFYQYACSNWMKSNPIPGDQPSWERFTELSEKNLEILHRILEHDIVAGSGGTPLERQLGAFYGACMDEKTVNDLGHKPIDPELDRIRAIQDQRGLSQEVAGLLRMGVDAIFSVASGQDFKDATQVVVQLDQAGIELPDRDYYIRTDKESIELREKYVKHISKMFELLGKSSKDAAADAAVVLKIETALAKSSLDTTSRRDPLKVYHPMPLAQLEMLAPAFDWKSFLPLVHGERPSVVVGWPDFFKGLNVLLTQNSVQEWKTYLSWQVVNARASRLSAPFFTEHFEFFSKTLIGQKEPRPRWKQCVALTDNDLGEALGQEYVTRTFGAEGKQRTLAMVRNIEAAMQEDINSSAWMTSATRQRALDKLHLVANKIGYPDKWRDYSSIKITPADLNGNDLRAIEFEFDRQMAKIGNPVDRQEWGMTPPTVNAYYNPSMNDINFPAGILQPPFYNLAVDDAVNYGAAGAVVGHELTHGFDDQGRQFDGGGNLVEWWTKDDAVNYQDRAKCIEDEYGNFVAVGDLKQNGKLTEGENIADNGGLRLAYMALTKLMEGKKLSGAEGFTPQQEFFLGYANVWCGNMTPELKRMQAQTNPHSLGEYRVNGTVRNMPEFAQAFSCKINQSMAPKTRCRVW